MKFQQILLVDDNENDVELTLAALSQHNLADRIVVARDGLEALDHLNAQKATPELLPSVIFLDQKMPKLNGIEVLRQIRSDPALTLLPVVMLTSSREEKDVQESYQQGANAYVVKPVGFQEFIDSVAKVGYFWGVLNENCAQISRSEK